MILPPGFTATLKSRVPIAEVVADYVSLRKAGVSRLMGLCPFHNERTPSFSLWVQGGTYHCFGCQASGDVIQFLSEVRGLSFMEAVTELGSRFGVDIPKYEPGEREEEAQRLGASQRQAALKANAEAHAYYRQALLSSPECQAYLAVRGVTLGAVEHFALGFAPADPRHLDAVFTDEGGGLAAGLFIERQGGPPFPRFRGRLMFPVRGLGGEVLGFSGRILPCYEPESKMGKYVNTPETAVYKKGETLYGLYEARKAMRVSGRAVLVEGNLDVVSLWQAGVGEVVAPLGTSLTLAQAHILRRLIPGGGTAIALYDGDTAGQEAVKKAALLGISEGFDMRVASLPAGEDPDSYARARGTEGLATVLNDAAGAFEHLLASSVDAAGPPGGPSWAREVLAEIGPAVAASPARSRTLYLRSLERVLAIEPHELRVLLQVEASEPPPEPSRLPPVTEAIPAFEAAVLAMLLQDPTARLLFSGRNVGALFPREIGALLDAVCADDFPAEVAAGLQRLAIPVSQQVEALISESADDGLAPMTFWSMLSVLDRRRDERRDREARAKVERALMVGDHSAATSSLESWLQLKRARLKRLKDGLAGARHG